LAVLFGSGIACSGSVSYKKADLLTVIVRLTTGLTMAQSETRVAVPVPVLKRPMMVSACGLRRAGWTKVLTIR